LSAVRRWTVVGRSPQQQAATTRQGLREITLARDVPQQIAYLWGVFQVLRIAEVGR
jgi:hypothetical protein